MTREERRYDKPKMTTKPDKGALVVWVVVDDSVIYDVLAFATYTDAAKFSAASREGKRSRPFRCPVLENVYPVETGVAQ